MSLPETIWWCEKHEWPALMSTYCGRPNPQMCRMIPLLVAGPDDLVIRREVVEAWLRMANNSEIFDLEYHLERALAAAEGEEE